MKKHSVFAYIKNNKHLLLILFVPTYIGVYFLVEAIVFESYHVMYTPLDDLIPFCEYFVIPYVMWYVLLVSMGLHLLFRDLPAYKRYMWFLIFSFGISVIICLIYPSEQQLRLTEFPRENFFTALIKSLYGTDTSTNVFPSIHCCGALSMLYSTWDSKSFKHPFFRVLLTLVCLSICAATVLIKQHSIVDFYGAVALCVPIAVITEIIKHRQKKLSDKTA